MKNNRYIPELSAEEQIFKYAVIFSVAVHLVIFVNLPRFTKDPSKRFLKSVEITYQDFKLQIKKPDSASRKKDGKDSGSEKETEVLLKKENPVLSAIKDMSKLDDQFLATNKQPAQIGEINFKKKVSVPALKSEKINNPLYQNYYQAVRSVIKKRAYANYSQSDTGEVYLTFVLLSDGKLKQLQVIDEKTSANAFLRDISLKSIKEATPFPPFPGDLNYPELSFNVVISFEVEN